MASVAGTSGPPTDPPPDLIPTPVGEGGKWFMNEPTRSGWFLLRYSDSKQSAADFVRQAADANMNLLCLTVGGGFAFYPSARVVSADTLGMTITTGVVTDASMTTICA